MNLSLTLPPMVANWASTQSDPQAAILAVLTQHVETTEAPYHQVWRTLEQRIPSLPMGSDFTVRQIVGEDAWQTLKHGEKISFGIEVAKKADELGLVDVSKSKEGRYRRA